MWQNAIPLSNFIGILDIGRQRMAVSYEYHANVTDDINSINAAIRAVGQSHPVYVLGTLLPCFVLLLLENAGL